jgi:hypothetical protein
MRVKSKINYLIFSDFYLSKKKKVKKKIEQLPAVDHSKINYR